MFLIMFKTWHALPRSQNRFSLPPDFRRISGGYPAAAPPQNRRPTARLPSVQPAALPETIRRPIRSTCPVISGLLPASFSDVSRHQRNNHLGHCC